MAWAKLVVEATSALAWPVTLLVILLIFRKAILERVGPPRRIKFGSFELELGDLEKRVEKSVEIADPGLPISNLRLAIEEQIIELAHSSLDEEATHRRISQLIERLQEKRLLSTHIGESLQEYLSIAARLSREAGLSGADAIKALTIGASLLAQLQYLKCVQHLIHSFDGRMLWEVRRADMQENKYYLWSAIAAAAPEFDYSYEAFREAATKFNAAEEQRAHAAHREPRRIPIPALSEFVDILRFRQTELQRIIRGEWWDGTKWEKLREWQWPEAWGHVGWNQPVVSSRNEADQELLRTEVALERYEPMKQSRHTGTS